MSRMSRVASRVASAASKASSYGSGKRVPEMHARWEASLNRQIEKSITRSRRKDGRRPSVVALLPDQEPKPEEPEASGEGSEVADEDKWSLFQAVAINTLSMFGTGPFITIPFLFAAVNPSGTHALWGYTLAAFACLNDSLVWGELGSMFPRCGGSYVYMREAFGPNKLGRVIAFLYVWQFLMAGPMELASGFVAMSQYFSFVMGTNNYWAISLLGLFFLITAAYCIWRGIRESFKLTVFLWITLVSAILFTWIAGFANFDTSHFSIPSNAYRPAGVFVFSLGSACRFGIYDFTGYFDINFIGDDVQNPETTIGYSNVITCASVCVIYFLCIIAVVGVLPWGGESGFVALVEGDSDGASYIMSLFAEKLLGYDFACFFTIIIMITIWASGFGLLLAFQAIPAAAAYDGYFFEIFKFKSQKKVFTVSLVFVTAISAIFCFISLDLVIEGMLTTKLLIEFIMQSLAVINLRRTQPDRERQFKIPLYPLPVICQMSIFFFVFLTTPSYFVDGSAPLLELGVLFIILGLLAYCLWASKEKLWPWEGGNALTPYLHLSCFGKGMKPLDSTDDQEFQGGKMVSDSSDDLVKKDKDRV